MTRLLRPLACAASLALGAAGSAHAQRVDWRLVTEPVADVGESGFDPGTFWGFHQSIVVRSGDHLYAVLMDSRGPEFDKGVRLFERDPAALWRQVWTTPAGTMMNQPPNLAVDAGGRVHMVFQLDSRFQYTSWQPGDDLSALVLQSPTSLFTYRTQYPYASVAMDAAGALFEVGSEYEFHHWILRDPAGQWRRGTAVRFEMLPGTDIWDRFAYPFVVLDGREALIFSTQDSVDPAKEEAGVFPYQFRVLRYYYSPDYLDDPFETTQILDRRPGGSVRHYELLKDRAGVVHMLYGSFEVENDWNTTGPLTHAFGPPGGPFVHVPLGPYNLGRMWEAADGTLWVICESGWQAWGAPLGPDGAFAFAPESVGFEPHFGGLFAVSPRAVVGGSPFFEGLYWEQVEGTHGRVHYFRVEPQLVATTAVAGLGAATPAVSRLAAVYPNPFNGAVALALDVSEAGPVRIEVFGLAGQRVRLLADGHREAGIHSLRWDGRDDGGAPVASGVYLVRLRAVDGVDARLVALLR